MYKCGWVSVLADWCESVYPGLNLAVLARSLNQTDLTIFIPNGPKYTKFHPKKYTPKMKISFPNSQVLSTAGLSYALDQTIWIFEHHRLAFRAHTHLHLNLKQSLQENMIKLTWVFILVLGACILWLLMAGV